MSGGLLILGGGEIGELLAEREEEIAAAVDRAYRVHHAGQSSLPHSLFLRFPGDDTNRIIALPAFLGDGFALAGMKWISSFPGNVSRGIPRASAVLVLNDCETGLPEAILEGSLISARRTAASAALAARALHRGPVGRVGLIGTGLINFEVVRFLRRLMGADTFLLHDLDAGRAERFAAEAASSLGVEATVAGSLEEVLAACPVTSLATTATRPWVSDLSPCTPGATILHVSLRDLTPEVILACDNVVDDVDHVCRAQTSVHLAEQATSGRGFIRCALAEILAGTQPARRDDSSIAVFSPFGLGVLDLAVGQLALEAARAAGRGTRLPSFFSFDMGALFT
ncbi:MAG: 2,3-diaminopropionate biosynthesis protein SbnB [Thermoanaerobaculia bacterium]